MESVAQWKGGLEFAGIFSTGHSITKDTPDDRLTLERSKQLTIESWKRPEKKR